MLTFYAKEALRDLEREGIFARNSLEDSYQRRIAHDEVLENFDVSSLSETGSRGSKPVLL